MRLSCGFRLAFLLALASSLSVRADASGPVIAKLLCQSARNSAPKCSSTDRSRFPPTRSHALRDGKQIVHRRAKARRSPTRMSPSKARRRWCVRTHGEHDGEGRAHRARPDAARRPTARARVEDGISLSLESALARCRCSKRGVRSMRPASESGVRRDSQRRDRATRRPRARRDRAESPGDVSHLARQRRGRRALEISGARRARRRRASPRRRLGLGDQGRRTSRTAATAC